MGSELDLRNGVGAAHLVMAPLLPLLSYLSHIPSLSVHSHPSLGSPAYRVLFVRGRVGAVGEAAGETHRLSDAFGGVSNSDRNFDFHRIIFYIVSKIVIIFKYTL